VVSGALWFALGSWHGLRSRVSLNLRASKAAGCAETPNKVQGFLSFPGTGDARNKSFLTVVLLLGGLVAACVSAQLVLADDWKTLGLIALGFACLAFPVKILNNWRQGLYIFFAWLFFADSVREYLGNHMTVCFAQVYLWILPGVLFRLPKLVLSVQFAPVAPAPVSARTVNGLAEQPIFPSMSADSGGSRLASHHEG
jgi:hypothetical protein